MWKSKKYVLYYLKEGWNRKDVIIMIFWKRKKKNRKYKCKKRYPEKTPQMKYRWPKHHKFTYGSQKMSTNMFWYI